MKIILICFSFVVLASAAHANVQPEEFSGKYLFTHSKNPKIKEYNDVISQCFKLNSAAIAVLKTYTSCMRTKGRQTPLEKSIGECSRVDGADAFFFNDKAECESARADTVDGAST